MPVKCTSNGRIQANLTNAFLFVFKPILNLWKRDFFLNKSCKGRLNIDRPYSFLETPVHVFKHVLWITIDYVNNNMLPSISPPFAKLALFLSSQKKEVNVAMSESVGTPLNNCASPQKCREFMGCGESGCQNSSSVLQLKWQRRASSGFYFKDRRNLSLSTCWRGQGKEGEADKLGIKVPNW